ncbi:MAG: TetR/AcrR family transcriptional regulator [Persicimonas sp.]
MTKHRSPDERADQILEAARACFMRRGYFATKMDEIARESGLSKGGIYFHFDSKRHIFRRLVEREYQRDMAFIESVIDAERDIAAILVELGEHFVQEFAATDKPRFTAIIAEMAIRDEEIQEMLTELQQNYIGRLTRVIEQAIEQGEVRAVDAEATATILKAIIDGIQAAITIGGTRPDIEQLLMTSMDVLTHGLIEEGALDESAPES